MAAEHPLRAARTQATTREGLAAPFGADPGPQEALPSVARIHPFQCGTHPLVARVVESEALSKVALRSPREHRASGLVFWLGLLATQRAASTGRFRGARVSGWFVALSGVLSVALAVWIGAGDVADLLALRVLAYAAWLYALLGLPALLHPEFSAVTATALSRLRGVGEIGPLARGVGLFVRLGAGLLLAALPGICLAALSSETVVLLGWRLGLVLFSAAYLLLLAASLAAVGVLAEKLAPRTPRRYALGLVLVPYLIGLGFPSIPSIPGAFFWAFERLVHLGGYIS